MGMTWLANADKDTAWAHHGWTAFRDLPDKARTLVVLPVHGFADHGLGQALDVEEVVGSAILHPASALARSRLTLRVLPPLRFAVGPYPHCHFAVDPETAHELVAEIAQNVKAAGFSRLVFFCTSPWNEQFIDAASRDARAHLGLQTFVVNLSGVGVDFHPAGADRPVAAAIAAHLLGTPDPLPSEPGEVLDEDFRPGNFAQPPGLAPDPALDGARLLTAAARHLARLLGEIASRKDLAGRPQPTFEPFPASLPVVEQHLWPRYRERYLPAMTTEQIADLPAKHRGLVIIPTGAIEQHGPHLPVGVDAILGQAWLDAALPLLPEDAPVWVAPPITFGKSNEHIEFPGTVYISAKTLRRQLMLLAQHLQELGFSRIGILNTHGGNSAVVVYTLREIQCELGLSAGMVASGYRPEVSDQEATYGFHAGEIETSWMLAVTEGLVDMEKATCHFPAQLDDPGELRPESAPAIFSWITSDISPDGVMGDATIATMEKGERWMQEGATALAQRILQLVNR